MNSYPRAVAVLEVTVTALLWLALYYLNAWVFSLAVFTKTVSWVFLPAAIRLLAVLLWDWRGALGIWVGTLATNVGVFAVLSPESLGVASISAAAPLLAVSMMRHRLHLHRDLAGLDARSLALLALASAAFSVVLHSLFFLSLGLFQGGFAAAFSMLVGDALGTLLVLYFVKFAARVAALL